MHCFPRIAIYLGDFFGRTAWRQCMSLQHCELDSAITLSRSQLPHPAVSFSHDFPERMPINTQIILDKICPIIQGSRTMPCLFLPPGLLLTACLAACTILELISMWNLTKVEIQLCNMLSPEGPPLSLRSYNWALVSILHLCSDYIYIYI